MNKDKLFSDILKTVSGADTARLSEFDIFNRIIGFKGVIDGVGCSTVVANTAIALAERGLNVCVVDTSILYPTQSLLLGIPEYAKEEWNERDWFSIGESESTSKTIKQSKYNSNIGVLGFNSKHTLVDYCSTYDNRALVDVAFNILERLYDIILVDLSNEVTNITTVAAIKCHAIYQVWSDEFIAMSSIESFLKNMRISSIQAEKMRTVILNKNGDAPEEIESLMKKYNFEKLADIPYSPEYALKARKGLLLHQLNTRDVLVNKMPEQYDNICNRILGLDVVKGSISGKDIVEGKVEGTVTKKMRDRAEEVDKILKADVESINDEELRKNAKERLNEISSDNSNNVTEDSEAKKKGFFKKKR